MTFIAFIGLKRSIGCLSCLFQFYRLVGALTISVLIAEKCLKTDKKVVNLFLKSIFFLLCQWLLPADLKAHNIENLGTSNVTQYTKNHLKLELLSLNSIISKPIIMFSIYLVWAACCSRAAMQRSKLTSA